MSLAATIVYAAVTGWAILSVGRLVNFTAAIGAAIMLSAGYLYLAG